MGHDWDIFQWPQHCSRPKIHQNVPTKSNLWRNVYMYCGFQSYLMQNFFWSIQSRISFDKKGSVSYFTFGIHVLPSTMSQKILIHSKAKHCQWHNGPRLLSPLTGVISLTSNLRQEITWTKPPLPLLLFVTLCKEKPQGRHLATWFSHLQIFSTFANVFIFLLIFSLLQMF